MKKAWRIGTNWGNENVLHVFKKHGVAFAYQLENRKNEIEIGDLIGITNGNTDEV